MEKISQEALDFFTKELETEGIYLGKTNTKEEIKYVSFVSKQHKLED